MKTKFKIIILLLLVMISIIVCTSNAHAATYSFYLGNYNSEKVVSSYSVVGHNLTHGAYLQIGGSISTTYTGRSGQYYFYNYYFNYTLPDDGCAWRVIGAVDFYEYVCTFDPNTGSYACSTNYFFVNIDETRLTSGSFSGYSPKTATDAANNAYSAANDAKNSAETAVTNATNAMNAANSANTNAFNAYNSLVNGVGNNGKSLSATWDQANSANTYATEARNEIRFGSYNGGKSLGATYDQASAANSNANTASARTWDTVSGKSAATLAREARDNAGSASTNAINAYNEAHTANTKLDTMQTSITNIQNNMGDDTTPPVIKVRTVSGAMATSGSSIQAVLDISDNTGPSFNYSLDGLDYIPVPANRIISLLVTNTGPNVIPVWVKDQAGNVGTASITIRKI